MENTNDIRNREIKIKVKSNEDATSAISRYMSRMGFEIDKWVDGKGLTHQYFFSKDYSELWISFTNFINDNTIVFQLNGNR